jgi:hypothetical protein
MERGKESQEVHTHCILYKYKVILIRYKQWRKKWMKMQSSLFLHPISVCPNFSVLMSVILSDRVNWFLTIYMRHAWLWVRYVSPSMCVFFSKKKSKYRCYPRYLLSWVMSTNYYETWLFVAMPYQLLLCVHGSLIQLQCPCATNEAAAAVFLAWSPPNYSH